ncbi:MAG: SAM-dependent methyltransferase [Ruminococcaceae bacterium]|nr:SAM-dependent methyltransferase [Oscillospiraceae bacterium]
MPLNSRLLKIAGMIREGDRVADIGTDHAYLPVFLIKEGKCSEVFACDVSDGPLKRAAENIEKSGVSGITLRKGDGLAAVEPYEVDTAVIAGMGGDLIARILEAAEWSKNERYDFIVQPMTSVEDLRDYICKAGFEVVAEEAVESQGRIYTVMKIKYSGSVRECDPVFRYFGRLLENPTDPEFIYIRRMFRILRLLCKKLKQVVGKSEQVEGIEIALSHVEGLIEQWHLTDYFYSN